MKQVTNKEYEKFQKYKKDVESGRVLTPDGLEFLCSAFEYDAEKIGRHMLEVLGGFQNGTT